MNSKAYTIFISVVTLAGILGCDNGSNSDTIQRRQQEVLLNEATREVGLPAISNFRERRLLKSILEMRDQEISTFTYITTSNGSLELICESIGYGIPYATQFTNPEKIQIEGTVEVLPQADPNGLFSPSSAEGTWVMCKDPNGSDVSPVLIEPRIIVSPFKLATNSQPSQAPEHDI